MGTHLFGSPFCADQVSLTYRKSWGNIKHKKCVRYNYPFDEINQILILKT